MTLYQLKNGYRYNSDTLFLYNFITNSNIFGDVLDVGCGCGILGLLLKRDFKINLTLNDIQKINCKIAQKNIQTNDLKAQILEGDFQILNFEHKFDFIVSNPPFYNSSSKKSENLHIATSRYNQNLPLNNFLSKANSLLKPRGIVAFCYDIGNILEILTTLKGLKLNLIQFQPIYPNFNKPAKLGLFKAQKNSKSPCIFQDPIFVFENQNYSKKAEEIFKKAKTISKDLE